MQGVATDDVIILRVLDLVERQGLSARDAGAVVGLSRNSVLGLVKRVRDDLALSESALCPPGAGSAVRPGNRDGDLGPLWWAAYRPAARGLVA